MQVAAAGSDIMLGACVGGGGSKAPLLSQPLRHDQYHPESSVLAAIIITVNWLDDIVVVCALLEGFLLLA